MAATLKKHPEFEFTCDPQDWAHVRLLLAEVEEDLTNRDKALLYRLSIWLMALKAVRKQTTLRLVLHDPTERDLGYHKALVASLRGYGQLLFMELRHSDTNLAPAGVTLDDVGAMLVELEMQEREFHGDMKPEQRESILEEVFG